MTEAQQPASGFVGRLQQLPLLIRVVVFILIFGGIFMALFGAVAAIYYQNVRSIPRINPISLQEDRVTVSEFAVFPEDEADIYPDALASAADGTLYIGSYLTGTVFAADANGEITELPTTRDSIGSISGLDWSAGTLYILDRLDPIIGNGGIVWSWDGNALTQELVLSAEIRNPILAPNDIAVDTQGNIYITDLLSDTVWRFTPDGERNAWWIADAITENPTPAGLAYNLANDSILITDIALNAIYEVPVTASDTRTETTRLYRAETDDTSNLGLNGIAVSNDGRIFVAALDDNRVVELNLETGQLSNLAAGYRGSADVAYDTLNNRVFVTNWDQRWLTPVTFIILSTNIEPRLPFSVDVIEFTDGFIGN